MEKFFADLKETMNGAVKKSGELVELTKMKFAIGETKSALRTKFEQLGTLAYQTAKGDEASGDIAEQLIAAIDELHETLRQQEARLAALSNKKICPVCSKIGEEDAAFCPACGHAFREAE